MVLFYDKREGIRRNIIDQYLGFKEDYKKIIFDKAMRKYCCDNGCIFLEWKKLQKCTKKRDRYNLFLDMYNYRAEDWVNGIQQCKVDYYQAGTEEFWRDVGADDEELEVHHRGESLNQPETEPVAPSETAALLTGDEERLANEVLQQEAMGPRGGGNVDLK